MQNKRTFQGGNIDEMMCDRVTNPASYRSYRDAFERAHSYNSRPSVPVHVDIELTNTCNLKCAYCEIGKDPQPDYYQKKHAMSLEQVFLILDEAAQIGVRSVQFNVVNEPLMYKHLFEVIERASQLKFDEIFFITNGIGLSEQISLRLIDSGLTKLMISIDAFSSETYKLIRKSNKYERIVKNVRRFVALRDERKKKLPLVRVSFLVTPENQHEADAFVQYWNQEVEFVALQNLLDVTDTSAVDLNDAAKFDFKCAMPNFRVTVKADGTMKPCCVFYGDQLDFGNISETSIQAMWNNTEWREFQDMHAAGRWADHDVCRECVMKTNWSIDDDANLIDG